MPRYNGNIAEVDWATANDNILRRYGYVYDGINRLKAGYYQNSQNPSAKEYFERLAYDVNGNIKELKRSASIITGHASANLIDDLTYVYTGNQLQTVSDRKENSDGYPYLTTPNLITYDLNGNMISMLDKEISSIKYNYLNLPVAINGGAASTNFLYRADGVKVKKTYGAKETAYLDGFQYENGSIQFVPTAEGYYDFVRNTYIYNYTDHLGNVRLSYYKNSAGALTIDTENNYYPFGLKHTGYNENPAASAYNYKYNGKELQETGMYAMDFRHYMPDVGRFTGMDRISEIMPDWTPYRFAFNNPSYFSDPTGLFEEGGNAFAHCPTCPNTPEFQPYIDDKDNVYVYNSETNTASLKVTPIEEVVVTGQKSSSVNYAGVDNNISSSLWWTNTAVGAASAYTVYKGQYHLNNELWRYQPYGKQKIITPWSKMKNGRNYWNNNLASKARLGQLEKVKGIRNISSKLTKAGGVLLAADIVLSGEIKPSHIINGAMLGASTTGVGAIVAGAWFIADFGTMGANYLINGEAKGLGDMLDESVGTYEMYDGVY